MKAFRLLAPGETALVEVDRPVPGAGQVLIRVGSASFCHSDLELRQLPANVPGIPLPVTLGHEFAGYVEELGPGVSGWQRGDEVAVHIIEGCGRCRACGTGRDNLCERGVIRTPGVHYDGGVAEYAVVEARNLLALDGVAMDIASPLTDAGLTAHHAVEWARPLLDASATALVVGVGGLGHLGLQIVAATSAARVLAVDVDPAKVKLALQLGAAAAMCVGADTAADVLDANGGQRVTVVLDFVGAQPTVDLAADVVMRGGMVVVAGMGGGVVPISHGFGATGRRIPPETPVVTSFAGGRLDLQSVLALARRGLLHVETTNYALDDAATAFADFEAGRVVGRATMTPAS